MSGVSTPVGYRCARRLARALNGELLDLSTRRGLLHPATRTWPVRCSRAPSPARDEILGVVHSAKGVACVLRAGLTPAVSSVGEDVDGSEVSRVAGAACRGRYGGKWPLHDVFSRSSRLLGIFTEHVGLRQLVRETVCKRSFPTRSAGPVDTSPCVGTRLYGTAN